VSAAAEEAAEDFEERADAPTAEEDPVLDDDDDDFTKRRATRIKITREPRTTRRVPRPMPEATDSSLIFESSQPCNALWEGEIGAKSLLSVERSSVETAMLLEQITRPKKESVP